MCYCEQFNSGYYGIIAYKVYAAFREVFRSSLRQLTD